MAAGGAGGGRSEPGMWQQFRRRRVTRTVLLYLAFAFLAIEAFLFASGLFAMPPWGLRAVVGAAVLGFPFAVVLAWTYDVTPAGIVKTPEDLHAEPVVPRGRKQLWLTAGAAAAAGLVLELLRR